MQLWKFYFHLWFLHALKLPYELQDSPDFNQYETFCHLWRGTSGVDSSKSFISEEESGIEKHNEGQKSLRGPKELAGPSEGMGAG